MAGERVSRGFNARSKKKEKPAPVSFSKDDFQK